MKLLFVHAHYDDFEFTAAGTFLLWGGGGSDVQRRVLVCTDGAAGHHRMSREETAARRWREQKRAAELGGFEVRLLRGVEGQAFREGRLGVRPDLVPSIWKEIREFEPDYLFCPPIPESPLAGIHSDHLEVARAVRSVAYFINVPHAFSPEFGEPDGEARFVRTPVIVNTFDGYMAGGHAFDIAVDIGSVVDRVADLALCHESQVKEWLPWVDRHGVSAPADAEGWRRQFRELLRRRNQVLGVREAGFYEYFSVTAWGATPGFESVIGDFPAVSRDASRLEALSARYRTG